MKNEMTIGNGLAVLCFGALLIAAAIQEKPEANFVAAPNGCRGADCAWCDATDKCMEDDSCVCFPVPDVPSPKPEPVPIVPPPDDDVGPIDDDELKAEPVKEIILHSRDNCPPCDSWWAVERPRFEAAGWVVALHVLSPNENGRTPFFTVEVDGKQFDLQGYQTLQQVEARIK